MLGPLLLESAGTMHSRSVDKDRIFPMDSLISSDCLIFNGSTIDRA
jgi:hypothetical protein